MDLRLSPAGILGKVSRVCLKMSSSMQIAQDVSHADCSDCSARLLGLDVPQVGKYPDLSALLHSMFDPEYPCV